jgi:hypothetical protein
VVGGEPTFAHGPAVWNATGVVGVAVAGLVLLAGPFLRGLVACPFQLLDKVIVVRARADVVVAGVVPKILGHRVAGDGAGPVATRRGGAGGLVPVGAVPEAAGVGRAVVDVDAAVLPDAVARGARRAPAGRAHVGVARVLAGRLGRELYARNERSNYSSTTMIVCGRG